MKYEQAIATATLYMKNGATFDEKKMLSFMTAKQLVKAVSENKLEKLTYHDYKLHPFNVYKLK